MIEIVLALRIIYCEVAARFLVVFLGLMLIAAGIVNPKFAMELLNGSKKQTSE